MKLTAQQKNQLRLIKGAPLTVLITLLIMGGFANNKALYFLYGPKTTAKAFDTLSDAGFVTKVTGGWQLTKGGAQLALQFQNSEKVGKIPTFNEKVGNIPTFAPTTTINNNTNNKTLSINSSSTEKMGEIPTFDEEVINTLKGVGVGDPMRSTLAGLDHVTLDYLQGHIAAWKAEKNPKKKTLGLLIHKIKSGDPVPDQGKDKSPERYIHGEFSEFIDH